MTDHQAMHQRNAVVGPAAPASPQSACARGAARRCVLRTMCMALVMCACMWAASPMAVGQRAPKRELRGVWLTTLGGLDWPSSSEQGNPERQKASLLRILDDIQEMHLNTVVFQVRSRGNAFYASSREPWAAELTGALGRDPGWDPLAFAISECHKRGLEVHAWVNVFRVWSGSAQPPSSTPAHVALQHPAWVKPYGSDLWLDPGIPDARAWCVNVVADIITRYDLDAVHLDYCRYPEADFKDDETYARFGGGRNKAEWRRDNVSTFVRDLHARAASLRPRMLVGAAPIGIYENIPTARGWQGLHAVSQDSRRWLREGWLDYLAPQVYWGLRAHGSSIDFEGLVRDWSRNASGRGVYIGTAPYRPEVKPWLGEHIDACRAQGAEGQVYFRYEHIRGGDAFAGRYATLAIPPAADWRDDERPHPPRALAFAREGGTVRLTWRTSPAALDGDTARRYVVYRAAGTPNIEDAASIAAILPGGTTAYTDTRSGAGIEYAVTALDQCGNESEPAYSTPPIAGVLPAPAAQLPPYQIADPVEAPGGLVLIAYSVGHRMPVRLRLMDERGAESMILVDDERDPGTYVVGIERSKLPEGIARFVFEAGTARVLRPFAPAE